MFENYQCYVSCCLMSHVFICTTHTVTVILIFFGKYDMCMLCEIIVMYKCIHVFVNDHHI